MLKSRLAKTGLTCCFSTVDTLFDVNHSMISWSYFVRVKLVRWSFFASKFCQKFCCKLTTKTFFFAGSNNKRTCVTKNIAPSFEGHKKVHICNNKKVLESSKNIKFKLLNFCDFFRCLKLLCQIKFLNILHTCEMN